MKFTLLSACTWCGFSLLIIALSQAAGAQARPWNQWGKIWATAFGEWSVQSVTPVTMPGTYTLTIDGANPPVVAGGPEIEPLAVNAPLLVGEGDQQELVTPSAVHCSWAPGNCTITLTLTKAHPAPFSLRSGTDGLQEAINYAQARGNIVEIDPGWLGTTAMITAANGAANVAIEDFRGAQVSWYDWDGSGYVRQLQIGPSGTTLSALAQPASSGALDVTQYPGGNCGAQEIGAMSAIGYTGWGSIVVPLTCGDAAMAGVWTPSTVVPAGQYVVDSNGGLQQATTAGTTAATPPTTWSTTVGGNTADGGVVWTLANANLETVGVRDLRTGSPSTPITHRSFYIPNIGITLWDNSAAQFVNDVSGNDPGSDVSPPDPGMAPIVKIVANEEGTSDPVPIFAQLNLNSTGSSAVNSVAGAFTTRASASDVHGGLWGINEVAVAQNPSFIPTMYGNEADLANETGHDATSPASVTEPTPYWGFAATGFGTNYGTAGYLLNATTTANEWRVGLLAQQNSITDAVVQCGSYLASFNPSAVCIDAQSQGAPSYSGGTYYNEASIPERDNAGVMTSLSASANSYIERQLVPGNTANPRVCWNYAFNASPVSDPLQQSCSDGLLLNRGWLENRSNFSGGAVPGADIGTGGFALGWNINSSGETDLVNNNAGGGAENFIWFAQAASGAQLGRLAALDSVGSFSAGGSLTAGANQSNQLVLTGAATGQAVTLSAVGTDSTISLHLVPKGSGLIEADGPLNLDGGGVVTPTQTLINNGTINGAGRFDLSAGALLQPASYSANGATIANPTASGALALAGGCAPHLFIVATSSGTPPTCTQPGASDLSNGTVGTGAVVLASAIPLSGSVAGATGTLAAGTCGDTVNLTVSGAAPGMVPLATSSAAFPAAANNLTVAAAVTAANTVTVGYCNPSTAVITPVAATIQVRVIP